jgi:predicted PurR-regulated permease PerM
MKEGNHSLDVNISTGTIIRIAIVGILIFAAFELSKLILSILTAIVIASFVGSAVNKLRRFIKNRTLAVFLIYIIVIALFIGLSSVFIPVFIDEMSALVAQLGNYIPDNSLLNTFQSSSISGAKDVVNTISKNASIGDVIKSTKNLIDTFSGGLFDIISKAFGGIFYLFITIIISFYLSIKEDGIESFLRVVIPGKQEEYVVDLWKRTERKIGLWLQGQMLLGLIIGLLAYLGMTIIGVKYSLVLSLITAVCLLIPFGIFIALTIATIFAYINGGVMIATLTALLYIILHQFENYLIAPLIVKKVIGISSLVVIIAVLVGAELAGVWGVILAVPCAVALFEIFEDIEKKKILARNN